MKYSDEYIDDLIVGLRGDADMEREQAGSKVRTNRDDAANVITALRNHAKVLASTVVCRADELLPGDEVVVTWNRRVPVYDVTVNGDWAEVAFDSINAPQRVLAGAEVRRAAR